MPYDPASAPRPLVLTLKLDGENQARLEAERRRWYPARLNRIPAHISLFHALPGEEEPAIYERLERAAGQFAPFSVEIHDLMRLGRGVAYAVRSRELSALHDELRAAWLPWLSRQDQQPFRPHVVIQNKVEPTEARALYDRLGAGFRPWAAEAAALLLWRYEGGPWSPAGEFLFAASTAAR